VALQDDPYLATRYISEHGRDGAFPSAVRCGAPPAVLALLRDQHMCPVGGIDAASQLTAMHHAVVNSDIRLVKELVARGVSVNAASGCGQGLVPLAVAILRSKGAVTPGIRYMVECGASLGAVDSFGVPLIHHAAVQDSHECLSLIVSNSPRDVHLTFNRYGYSILHVAPHPTTISYICAAVPDVIDTRCLVAGLSPLGHAVDSDDTYKAELLLALHADPNAIDSDGRPIVMYAKTQRMVQLLASAGCNTRVVDPNGNTMLHRAAAMSSVPMLEVGFTRGLLPRVS
jgi:ankyrin repeat protein